METILQLLVRYPELDDPIWIAKFDNRQGSTMHVAIRYFRFVELVVFMIANNQLSLEFGIPLLEKHKVFLEQNKEDLGKKYPNKHAEIYKGVGL